MPVQDCGKTFRQNSLPAKMKTKKMGGVEAAGAAGVEAEATGAPVGLSHCPGHVGECGALLTPAATEPQQATTHHAHAPTQKPASQCAARKPQSESESASASSRPPADPQESPAVLLPTNYTCARRDMVLQSSLKRVQRTPSNHTTKAGPLVPTTKRVQDKSSMQTHAYICMYVSACANPWCTPPY
jgi:hypothetical protein